MVDYVLSQTVTPFLEDTSKADSQCRVLDPACGSGIFLIETVRKIIEKELVLTGRKKISDARLWNLIKSNIYGIDIDAEAIDISIFSLYITILDYKQPAEIESFRFETLKNENFFGGDDADFFNESHIFNKKIQSLDFIVGNPPWGNVSKSAYLNYIERRNQNENKGKANEEKLELAIGDKEICQAFLVRTSDFGTEKKVPKCSLVVSSKVLYNSGTNSKKFRNYFLTKFHIKQVVELSPINNKIRGGNHIFDAARYPAAVITFIPEKNNKITFENLIQHITVKPNRFFLYYKTIVVEKQDVKNIKQSYFIEGCGGFDWLWKVLVYGNILDIHFIRKIKQQKDTSGLFNLNEYESNGGLKITDGKQKKDTSKILDFDYFDADKEFRPFIVVSNRKWKKEAELKGIKNYKIGYLPDIRFFQGSKLLFKKGVVLMPREGEHYFEAVTAFHEGDITFTSTVGSLIPKTQDIKESKTVLSALSAIFNSQLFTYYILNIGSSLGIEKSRINFDEFLGFPIKIDNELSRLALSITNDTSIFSGNANILKSKRRIEKRISQLYQLNDIELALIDYANSVSIPVLLRQKTAIFRSLDFSLSNDVTYMNAYLNKFINFLQPKFERINKILRPEILYTDYFVRINFYVDSKKSRNSQLDFTKVDTNDLQLLIGDLGVYKVCKNLYIQQDVRGFTSGFFYLIKPNERRLWHAAVSYLDAMEFEDELTKAQIKNHLKK